MRTVFDGLSLDLRAGQVVDLTGPSGSGKSTLLTTLAWLNPHATARLELRGESADSMGPQAWRRLVAYLPQRPVLTGETVREALLLPFDLRVARSTRGARTAGSRRADAAAPTRPGDDELRASLREAGLADVGLEHDPQELSVGQQARVCLLRTLLTAPEVLLADEVDAGLDAANAERVGSMLGRAAAGGMAVLRVRHHESDGRAARTLWLEGGVLREVADSGGAVAFDGARAGGEDMRRVTTAGEGAQ